MLCIAAETIYCRRVKYGVEQIWWQDQEMFVFSYYRGNRLWRHYLVHHPVTGVQIGYVRWWYGRGGETNVSYFVEEEDNEIS